MRQHSEAPQIPNAAHKSGDFRYEPPALGTLARSATR